jgi:EAL domain-containing protein (putative c-di-GMP-specific phosphodiesterase class I)
MVRSTIALAHQLGMKVVAEGVEDDATLALLRELECDVAQGWLIGRRCRRPRWRICWARSNGWRPEPAAAW